MRQVTLGEVKTMADTAKGYIDRIFLHWSAGHYGQPFADYHICIDKDGEVYAMTEELTEVLAHTWHQNTGSVGIAMLCCAFATTNDLGKEPPTEVQIEVMSQLVAVLCSGLGLPCDTNHVRTHAEQADIDNYGPATTFERWDLWFLHNGDEPGTGGDVLRGKVNWYMTQGEGS